MNTNLIICGLALIGLAAIMAAPIGQSRPSGRRGGFPKTKDEAKTYARTYGHKSIGSFQKFYRLKITDEVDNATLELMATPRCGIPDNNTDQSRRKRYVLAGTYWQSKMLTYLFQNYTSKLSMAVQRSQIELSFKDWSAVSQLSFTESKTTSANIKLLFARGDHGDGAPFNGTTVLAHAFYPPYGNTHFNADEQWTVGDNGIDLRQVATHELGHALGLGHSTIKDAVMFPYFNYKINFTLNADDIQGIQSLYGALGKGTDCSKKNRRSRGC